MDDSKLCHQCGLTKPRSAFTPRRQSWDGLRPECRDCRNIRQRSDYKKNLSEKRKYNREYMRRRRKANPEKARQEMKDWRARNPEKVAEIERKSYWKNREKRLAKSAKWMKQNPKRRAELARKWRRENLAKARAGARASQKRNREKVNQRNRNRRALKAAAEGRHTAADIKFLMTVQDGKCALAWCRKSIKKKYAVDHVIALARGGSNDRRNIQLLCPTCNLQKHAKHPIDFAQENGMLL